MSSVVNLDVQTINFLAGTLIPVLVGLIAKKIASSSLKAILNAALSAIAGGLALILAQNGTITFKTVIVSVLTTFVVSAGVYFGFYKPTGVTNAVQNKTANFGIGPSS